MTRIGGSGSSASGVAERLSARLPEAALLYHRLILLVGLPRSGKTTTLKEFSRSGGWSLVNINLRLCELLLDLTQKQRTTRLPRLLDDIVTSIAADLVILDNIEILFSPEFAQDPLRLLLSLSRHRTLVVSWSGTYDGSHLTYAEPGHPEARRYARPDALVVLMKDSSTEDQVSTPAHRASAKETE